MDKIKPQSKFDFKEKIERFILSFNNSIHLKSLIQRITTQNKRQILNPEKRIIFVDLDLTLFDYTLAREKAAKIALQELALDVSLDLAFKFYIRIVENWHSFILLGLPDLRRSWNNEIIYFLTIFFTSNKNAGLSADLLNLLEILERFENIEDAKDILCENHNLCQLFFNDLEVLKSNKSINNDVQGAVDKFEKATTKLEPFKDARDLLITLKKQKDYYVFIVSEGDVDIQWGKIIKLGLQDIIESTNFIVTDGLANPSSLLSIINKYEKNLLDQLSMDLPNSILMLKLDSLYFLKNQFTNFVNKKDRFFFAQALHIAIQVISNNFDKNDFSNISDENWKKFHPIKLATLGDRYSNDILPLLQLFDPNHLLSIHMKFGKYSRDKLRIDDPIPDFAVKKLSSAKKILIKESNWKKKYPINRPNQFPQINNISNRVFILLGLSFGKPICTIAEAMLQNAGFSPVRIRVLTNIVKNEIEKAQSRSIVEERLLEIYDKQFV